MRLLKLSSEGRFNLTSFPPDAAPDYAILSHRWGSDAEEVTYFDITNDTGRTKKGFRKLTFCQKRAALDGIEYFWIDTCCIDKTSSAELTEELNSMFRHYKNAKKCYAYLNDVSTGVESDPSSNRWKSEFKSSQWFTRGWTLQELIAPPDVGFYSSEEVFLGDKISMAQQIYETTGVPLEALLGAPLSRFNPHEKLSWINKRHTARGEDLAYAMLGILDVSMPVVYGEGQTQAFVRLLGATRSTEEMDLSVLPEEVSARIPTLNRISFEKRIRNFCRQLSAPNPSENYERCLSTRQDQTGLWFLRHPEYVEWSNRAGCLWLYGIPGCGKTILSTTIIQHLLEQSESVAYFYFDFRDQAKQKSGSMVRSLLVQVIGHVAMLSGDLETLLRRHSDNMELSSGELLKALRVAMKSAPKVCIIIDALDECCDRETLMSTLQAMSSWRLSNLHLLFTSRKEHDIVSTLETFVDAKRIIPLQVGAVDDDIEIYVENRLKQDPKLKRWRNDDGVQREIKATLKAGSHGMFRWAACQLDAISSCLNKLRLREALANLPKDLDATYERILCEIKPEHVTYAKRILTWIMVASRPLTLTELSVAVAIDVEREPAYIEDEVLQDPEEVFTICSSLIMQSYRASDGYSNPNSDIEVVFVTFSHYSVQEYLSAPRICNGKAASFSTTPEIGHTLVTRSWLSLISENRILQEFGNPVIPMHGEYLKSFKVPFINNLKNNSHGIWRYAVRGWAYHARSSKEDEIMSPLLLKFIDPAHNPTYYGMCYAARLYDDNYDIAWNYRYSLVPMAVSLKRANEVTPLVLTAWQGLTEISRKLVKLFGTFELWSALYVASRRWYFQNKHEDTFTMLFEEMLALTPPLLTVDDKLNAFVLFGRLVEYMDIDRMRHFLRKYRLSVVDNSPVLLQDLEPHLRKARRRDMCRDPALYLVTRLWPLERVKLGVELLLDHGANLDQLVETDGYPEAYSILAAEISRDQGQEDMVEFLVDAGADINLAAFGAKRRYTPLEQTLWQGNRAVAELLIRKGATVTDVAIAAGVDSSSRLMIVTELEAQVNLFCMMAPDDWPEKVERGHLGVVYSYKQFSGYMVQRFRRANPWKTLCETLKRNREDLASRLLLHLSAHRNHDEACKTLAYFREDFPQDEHLLPEFIRTT